jgi:tRNA 2-thiocytidine biosynthesis protein TtcA
MTTADPLRLAYWLLKDVNKAIYDYKMIADGDRVAVAVSGGMDSMSLLRLLDWRRKSVQERYELVAVHVIGDARGPACPEHTPLLSWLAQSGYAHAVEPMLPPEDEELPMNCQRCTWNRRRTLFESAHRLGCNVVALGHHADDLAETTLLNLLYHGRAETMPPNADYFKGVFRLIRPLCYLPKAEIKRFAKANDFPPPPPECPRSDKSNRKAIAALIRQAEKSCQDARVNLLRAGLRGIDSSRER